MVQPSGGATRTGRPHIVLLAPAVPSAFTPVERALESVEDQVPRPLMAEDRSTLHEPLARAAVDTMKPSRAFRRRGQESRLTAWI